MHHEELMLSICFSDIDHGRHLLQENQQENLETLHTPIILLCKM